MQEMTNLTHPIELSDEELDLVAAAGNCERCEPQRCEPERCEPDIAIKVKADVCFSL